MGILHDTTTPLAQGHRCFWWHALFKGCLEPLPFLILGCVECSLKWNLGFLISYYLLCEESGVAAGFCTNQARMRLPTHSRKVFNSCSCVLFCGPRFCPVCKEFRAAAGCCSKWARPHLPNHSRKLFNSCSCVLLLYWKASPSLYKPFIEWVWKHLLNKVQFSSTGLTTTKFSHA